MTDVDKLLEDIRDLQTALDECADSAKATRLRLTLASRPGPAGRLAEAGAMTGTRTHGATARDCRGVGRKNLDGPGA
jgi:hypothetical protein